MTNSDGDPTATMKKFYPTSDLVTGPDIIFFWVARMIMAGYQFADGLPFKNVFFTSLIRDAKGRKLSKSLGNSPDPLDLIDKYGADGVRFGLMRIAPMGTDIRYDEEQIVEGRNFATKLWNAARYRQMHESDVSITAAEKSIYAIDILAKLDALQNNIKQAYADYQFNEIAQLLYQFFWSEYCDWYLESCKGDFFEDADPAARAATLETMDTVFRRFLALLHPFMPHITEELWENFGFNTDGVFLMNRLLPTEPAYEGLREERAIAAKEQTTAIYEAVGRARNLKAEYNLAANRNVRFILDSSVDWIDGELSVLARLCGAEEVSVEKGYQAEQGVPVALTAIGKLYMPLEGLIDIDAEKKRLNKELEKTQAELTKVNSKLANEKFVSRAPEAIIEENRERQQHWKDRTAELEQMIANLDN